MYIAIERIIYCRTLNFVYLSTFLKICISIPIYKTLSLNIIYCGNDNKS